MSDRPIPIRVVTTSNVIPQTSFPEFMEQLIALASALPSSTPNEQHAPLLVKLYEILHNSFWLVPQAELWCVVKHYRSIGWKPVVWTAHMSKEQAEEFAPLIEKHYGSKYNKPEHRDQFKVERRLADINKLINPALTGKEYVSHLS